MNTRRPARNAKIRPLESLDERIVPSGPPPIIPGAAVALVTARGGPDLGSIFLEYFEYKASGGSGTFDPPEASKIYLRGDSVGVAIRFGSGDFKTLVGSLQGIGMHVTATDAQSHLVEGYLPISELTTVVTNSHEVSTAPVYKPSTAAIRPQATAPLPPPPRFTPPVLSTAESTHTPLTKASGALDIISQEYAAYVEAGSKGMFVSSQARVSIQGDMVGVDVRVVDGALDTVAGQLKGIGMTVSAVNTPYKIVEGLLPISELATVNNNSHVLALLAVYRPALR